MTTRAVDRVVLDTNVLLAATDEGRADHVAALAVLDEWPGQGTTLYVSGQIVREYLAVATRPPASNGLGLSLSDATANARAIRERSRFVGEDHKVSGRLLELVEQNHCAGKQVHDANIVATMLVHGIEAIVTLNTADFARFDEHIQVIKLSP
jgi:predicted nucleic acid-binding protein